METNNLPVPGANPQPSSEQLELLKQQDNNQLNYSLELLKAQERDRAAERAHIQALHEKSGRAWIWRSLILAGFLLAALYLGKEEFLTEALRYLAVLFGGGGIGYLYGYRKGQNRPMQ